jgi:ribulose-5-phosphate 4-epimerase/fuculose-1-phosphate aldolase
VIHTHSPAGMAVSALKCGLLPLTQNAMFFGEIGYHDYGVRFHALATSLGFRGQMQWAEAMP